MKKFYKPGIVVVALLVLLTACGPSAEEIAATETQEAANLANTQTAAAPTATFTPSPTPTFTPTFTPTITPTFTPTFTPTPFGGGSGKITFTSYQDGVSEIYIMNPDGSGIKQLTDNAWNIFSSAWSPDGSKITFSSGRWFWDEENFSIRCIHEIYIMNADGSGIQQLTDNVRCDEDPAWSPDGSKIAFSSAGEIHIINADGSGIQQLTYHIKYDMDPAWSPDGSKIAFSSNRDGDNEIYVMNADGSGIQQLTYNDRWDDRGPAWSPDGSKIAFSSKIVFYSQQDGDNEIYIMNADGNGLQQLTDNDWDDAFPAWSPDGSKILFYSKQDGDNEIYIMNADGSGIQQLTDNDWHDTDPAWLP